MRIKKALAAALLGAMFAVGPVAMHSATAGKPCNGCVGRADDKAPNGQSDGDKNAGYECDRNNGVGEGNPAHSNNCEQANG